MAHTLAPVRCPACGETDAGFMRGNCFASIEIEHGSDMRKLCEELASLPEYDPEPITEPLVPDVDAGWCGCGSLPEDQERWYQRANGVHGLYHPVDLGGCGGITQTG